VSIRIAFILCLAASLIALTACSRGGSHSDGQASTETSGAASAGNAGIAAKVRVAARALAEPEPSIDYVAAELKGVVKARTSSQALMYYDGYRVTLTTPGDRVTSIKFDLVEARPTMEQLTQIFGRPEEIGRGMLYRYRSEATGATIRILAEPATKPATDTSLARRILIEGEQIR
jgi:hypothetical protein